MNIKDMPHVTVEQVLALREAAIKLEKELGRYSMPAGLADQYRAEALACRKALGFEVGSEEVSPSDLTKAIDGAKADAVRAFDIPELDSIGDERVVSDALIEYADKLERGEV